MWRPSACSSGVTSAERKASMAETIFSCDGSLSQGGVLVCNFATDFDVSMLIKASESSSRGSGTKMLCSSHQNVQLVVCRHTFKYFG